jgi:tRNA threonylcarbamoyladenosine biosynthesis protein TsaE
VEQVPDAIHTTGSENETQAIARDFARRLRAGDIVLLSGNLGTGKTTFVRGLAEGFGIDPAEVSSPTFTLLHEYRGIPLTLYHADLYRVGKAAADDLGLEEAGTVDGVLAIEWPDRLTHNLAGAYRVDIQWIDDTTRRITLSGS